MEPVVRVQHAQELPSLNSTHPVDQLLSPGKLLALGIQHVLVMYAGAVAVPLIIGAALHFAKDQVAYLISCDLLCCGIATCIQSIGLGPFGIRLPVIMAVSFAAVGPMVGMAHHPELGATAIFGSTIAAGLLSILFAPIAGRMLRFFPPIVVGIVITAIGLAVVQVGINWAAGGVGNPEYGSPVFLGTSLAVLVFILLITRYVRGFLSNISVLLGIVFGFVIALLLGRVEFQGLADAAWLDIVTPFHFGWPTFDPLSILTLTIVQIVIFIESTGMFLALGEMVERPVGETDVVRGLRADGLATLIGGLLNSFPHSSFSQNVGLVGVTRVRSRWVTAIGGIILVVFGLVPKMSVLVASVPQFVLGGAGVIMFGMVLATGIRILAKVDYVGNPFNAYIVAVSVVLSMIPVVSDKFFSRLPAELAPLLHSGILLAALSAVVLNLYFNGTKETAAAAVAH